MTAKQAEKMTEEDLKDKILVGDFVKKELPTLEDLYLDLERIAQER